MVTTVNGKGFEASLFDDATSIAEKKILDLADYLYVHSSLKPMSKVIFILSRLLLIRNLISESTGPSGIVGILSSKYPELIKDQDFNISSILQDLHSDLNRMIRTIIDVSSSLPQGSDALGLIFNTLLRGKYESGEGLGTFLTPEEVVAPMVKACYGLLSNASLADDKLLFGDVAAGTGRFAYAILGHLKKLTSTSEQDVGRRIVMADQSKFSLDLAKINFLLDGVESTILQVQDSITSEKLRALNGQFAMICTNPPFGNSKYHWNDKLINIFPGELLTAMNFNGEGKVDPAILFFFRDLDLLADHGILGIVMPDGIVYSNTFLNCISKYEKASGRLIQIRAIVSLPSVTFALGGTVAKTSFLVAVKQIEAKSKTSYFAEVKHIGFLKKGNARKPDPDGNDLEKIERDIREGRTDFGSAMSFSELFKIPDAFSRNPRANGGYTLDKKARLIKQISKDAKRSSIHISILDIDETGFIDLWKASNNSPSTNPLVCKPLDILVSCINPRIWRVAIVPPLENVVWTCSSEFAVIRPNVEKETLSLFFSLMDLEVRAIAQSYAKGTSSSRQRISKEALMHIRIPEIPWSQAFQEHWLRRLSLYSNRMEDLLLTRSFWCSPSQFA